MLDKIVLPELGMDLYTFLAAVEETYIRQALARTDGNVSKAAKLLGLKRTTLRMKLHYKGETKVYAPLVDPQGEFTIERIGAKYAVLYKGTIIAEKYSIRSANKVLKEKIK